jgi:hypothetical protein
VLASDAKIVSSEFHDLGVFNGGFEDPETLEALTRVTQELYGVLILVNIPNEACYKKREEILLFDDYVYSYICMTVPPKGLFLPDILHSTFSTAPSPYPSICYCTHLLFLHISEDDSICLDVVLI